jgi:hypothetical protein
MNWLARSASSLLDGTLTLPPELEREIHQCGNLLSASGPIHKEDAMKTKPFILATIALFALGVASANAGPCATEIDNLTKALAAKDAGSGPTAGASGGTHTTTTAPGQHPPTSVMRQETEGKAASPEDVRRQTTGQAPAAQQGAAGTTATTGAPMPASSALERARTLDQQGKEAECMAAVREAKQLAGAR